MEVLLWLATAVLVIVFGASALVKGTQTVDRTVELGMTGVVGMPLPLMRVTAACEAVGVIGLVVPHVSGVLPVLTPVAAVGLGLIMIPAASIHLRLGEPRTALGNLVLLALCVFVAWGRWPG